ncbi:MAG: hypothetical protein ACSLFR_16205, partial [Solirubrobacteraceae bacterium]
MPHHPYRLLTKDGTGGGRDDVSTPEREGQAQAQDSGKEGGLQKAAEGREQEADLGLQEVSGQAEEDQAQAADGEDARP